jgi:hypothetical protein
MAYRATAIKKQTQAFLAGAIEPHRLIRLSPRFATIHVYGTNRKIAASEFVYMCAKLDNSASRNSDSAGTHDAAGLLVCAEGISSALTRADIAMVSCFKLFINKQLYLDSRDLELTDICQQRRASRLEMPQTGSEIARVDAGVRSLFAGLRTLKSAFVDRVSAGTSRINRNKQT